MMTAPDTPPMELTHDALSSILHYGYLPDTDPDLSARRWYRALADDGGGPDLSGNDDDIADRAIGIFRRSFRDLDGDPIVVPLSGGLDSRAILGGLLEAGVGDRIVCVTFGTPGTFDYEIGRMVAEFAGVRHEAIDLTSVSLSRDELVRFSAETGGWNLLFDAYYNNLLFGRYGPDAVVWSGFFGDALTGNHLPERESGSWEDARRHFARKNRMAVSVDLTPPGFRPEDALPETPFLPRADVSFDDQLDFGVRQESYIRKLFSPERHAVRMPFETPELVRFFLALPRRYRMKQYLYKKILIRAFPGLFSLPTKNTYGLGIDADESRIRRHILFLRLRSAFRRFILMKPATVNPETNYIDFEDAIRHRDDVRTLVHESVRDLKQRGVIDWLDTEALLERHMSGRAEHGDALTLLTSLEIHLKARDAKEAAR